MGEGEPAHFECRVDAHPLTETTIMWRRPDPNYDMKTKTKTTRGLPGPSKKFNTVKNARETETKSVNTHFSTSSTELDTTTAHQTASSNVGVLLLTVLNATADDSGPFWCVADNGIGSVEIRNATYLLVRRKYI